MPCLASKSNAWLGKPRDLVTVGTVLRTKQRQQLSGWLCLLGCALHLLAPLCPAARHLPRTLVKDGLNQQTTFKYDGLNRLIEQRFADGDTWTHTYNAVQKTAQTSPRGIVTSYGYDARDRLLTVTASGAEGGIAFPPTSRSYTYDNAGKLKTVTESTVAAGVSTPNAALAVSYTYDAMGRVTAESSHGQTHQYEYDLAGNRTKVTYSTGRIVETSYDGLNRPEAIVDGDRLTRYGYDKAGRAVILVAANGQTSQNTYDALGRLTDRTLFKTPAMSEANVLAEFSWEHDLLGNVTQQEEIWPGETARSGDFLRTTMGYDANNRLISESIVTYYETYDEGQITTYTYDDANNRTSKSVNGGAEPGHWDYTYNAANQLTAWEHLDYPNGSVLRSATLTYDDAGNRTSQAVTQVSGSYNPTYNPQPAVSGLTQYTWDAQDRLASVTLPDGSEHRYAYDYRTRRVGTHETPSPISNPPSAAKHTAIVFSGGLSVAEWEQESGTGLQPVLSAPPTVEYTRGPDMGGGVGGLLYTSRSESASASVSSSRTLRYNLSNGRGDIVAQSDSYASLTWTASYEAYGKRTKETGENKDKQRGNSKDEDPTGLLNEGFRYRDIETGVWLSRDPAGFVDGPNVYAYVKQNPWTSFDPDGLKTKNDYRNDIQDSIRRRDEKIAKITHKEGSRAWHQMRNRIYNESNHQIREAQKKMEEITATAREMESVARMEAGSIIDELVDDESDSYVKFDRLGLVSSLPFFNSKLGEHVNHGEVGGVAYEAAKEIVIAFATFGLGKLVKVTKGGKVYSGAFHPQSGNGIMRPSSYHSPLPEGWVPAKGGHASVGAELVKEQGVLLDDLQGFTAFDRGAYWQVEFKSALNSPDLIPGTVLPQALRGPILESIERNTGKAAIGTTKH